MKKNEWKKHFFVFYDKKAVLKVPAWLEKNFGICHEVFRKLPVILNIIPKVTYWHIHLKKSTKETNKENPKQKFWWGFQNNF